MNISIGTNIKKYRAAKNITQEQLAESLGVSCAAVSKWERNETYPDITLIFPLAHYFDVSVDDLMGYNRTAYEREIEELIRQYRVLYREDFLRARELITDAL